MACLGRVISPFSSMWSQQNLGRHQPPPPGNRLAACACYPQKPGLIFLGSQVCACKGELTFWFCADVPGSSSCSLTLTPPAPLSTTRSSLDSPGRTGTGCVFVLFFLMYTKYLFTYKARFKNMTSVYSFNPYSNCMR